LADLRIGAAVLLEAIETQMAHEKDLEGAMKTRKAEEATRVELVRP
jgi:hypothetical protein